MQSYCIEITNSSNSAVFNHIIEIKVVNRVIGIVVNLSSKCGDINSSASSHTIPLGVISCDSKAETILNVWLEVSIWEVEDQIEMELITCIIIINIVIIIEITSRAVRTDL